MKDNQQPAENRLSGAQNSLVSRRYAGLGKPRADDPQAIGQIMQSQLKTGVWFAPYEQDRPLWGEVRNGAQEQVMATLLIATNTTREHDAGTNQY